MSGQAVRFIHTSDFHLERPVGGIAEVPPHLREAFIEAPFLAAERVFDSAIKESVDFVILAGDVLDIELAGPRAIDFLVAQFHRLRENKIQVYWIGGKVDDPELWPVEIALPKNVHVFSTGSPQEIEFKRKGRTVVTLVGQSQVDGRKTQPTDFRATKSDATRIAIAYGPANADEMRASKFDYWALGGLHDRKIVFEEVSAACYSGNPQGLSPLETGVHGGLLVTVEHGRVRTRVLDHDVIRWHNERIELATDATRNELEKTIYERLSKIVRTTTDQKTLVRWTVISDGPLGYELRNSDLARSVLDTIRNKQESGPTVESIQLDSEIDLTHSELMHEDTIMGDFLRTLQEFDTNSDRTLDLAKFLPSSTMKSQLTAAMNIRSRAERQKILQQAAALGFDLLRGAKEGTTETVRS